MRYPARSDSAHIADAVSSALQTFQRYKLRTALSNLGVILGVAAVITGLSVNDGAKRDALRSLGALGLDHIVVRNGARGSDIRAQNTLYGLTVHDAHALRLLVPATVAVVEVSEQRRLVAGAVAQRATRVLEMGEDYESVVRASVSHGRLFTRIDPQGGRVCVVGVDVARQLFHRENPLGEYLKIAGQRYRIVGVVGGLRPENPSKAESVAMNLTDAVLVSVAGGHRPDTAIDEIWLQVQDPDRVIEVGSIVDQTLQGLHHGVKDFDVLVPQAMLAERLRTQRTFDLVGVLTAGLLLLVGGVGIMNLMLASVVERMSEIGLRRSVGATQRSIALQFLAESSAIGMAGGCLGVVLGVGASFAAGSFAGWPVHVSADAIAIGLITSLLTAVIAGSYPARRAARISPVEALATE